MQNSASFVDVFPINTAAFGFRANWFATFVPQLIQPSYLLITLLLVVSIGIMALKRFDNVDLERKLWNVPIILIAVTIWPVLILGLKDLVDTFNGFLVHDIFQIPWDGFGYPKLQSITHIFGWTADGLARLLPNLAYWIVYAFYIVFFFFYAVLGPFILAKGIIADEIEGFLDLLKEVTNLFLWQTMLVILVAFIMPAIVSGAPFPSNPETNFYFLSFILGIMILFVPSLTRKFVGSMGSTSIFPRVFRLGGTMLALSGIARIGSLGLSAAGVSTGKGLHEFESITHRVGAADDFRKKYQHIRRTQHLEQEQHHIEHEIQHDEDLIAHQQENPEVRDEKNRLLEFLKKAKDEMQNDRDKGPDKT